MSEGAREGEAEAVAEAVRGQEEAVAEAVRGQEETASSVPHRLRTRPSRSPS